MQKRLYSDLEYLLECGVPPEDLNEEVEEINALESKIRYHKRDRGRERAMSSPVTKNALSRAASRPTNRRRMQQGFQRWLKLKGRKQLQKTAAKRFEGLQYEWEDVKMTVEKDLINIDRLSSKFEGLQFESGIDNLTKVEFLYKEFSESFPQHFNRECELSGVIVDPIEEDTTTADIATPQGGFMSGNRSPWKMEDPEKQFWYPMLVHELLISMNQMCAEERDEEIREALVSSMGDLDLMSYDKKDLDRLEGLLDYLDREFGYSHLTPEELEILDMQVTLELAKPSLKLLNYKVKVNV